MRNNKGFLLGSEMLKIIIAVICIAFLVYVLTSIYFSATGGQKIKEAQAVVNGDNGIEKEIRRINKGGTYDENGFFVQNPSDWYIFSFTGDEKKPNMCGGENCLCVCEEVFLNLLNPEWQMERCDEKGDCAVVSNLKGFEPIKIDGGGILILIKKVEEMIEITKK